MTIDVNQAVRLLRGAYAKAPKGEKVLGIHLFGIKYADELQKLISDGTSIKEIVEKAHPLGDSKGSYVTEISKGMKLAKYVSLKEP